jgi:bile acid:Na+ symporter, BASS family
MSLSQLIPLVIQCSILMVVFSFGLRASLADAIYLFRQPGLFARSVLSMNVIMFAVAVAAALMFDLHPAVKIALIALALSPVPPMLAGKQMKAGGGADYAIGLLVAMSVLALVVVPIGLAIAGGISGTDVRMPAFEVAPIVLSTVILPLGAGIAVRHFFPAHADRTGKGVQLIATLILVVALIPMVIAKWPVFSAMLGDGTLAALTLFAVIGLAVGHLLGGPDEEDRTVLALATSARHPALALAIAKSNFLDDTALVAVVFWSLIVAALVAIPYSQWRKRVHAELPCLRRTPQSRVHYASDKGRA